MEQIYIGLCEGDEMSDEILAGQAKELFRLMTIEQAAKKLCECKGRFHTEIAMKELMKLFESEKNERTNR